MIDQSKALERELDGKCTLCHDLATNQISNEEGDKISYFYGFKHKDATREEIDDTVRVLMPVETCKHMHDCCGNLYCQGGKVFWNGSSFVIVVQFHRNV